MACIGFIGVSMRAALPTVSLLLLHLAAARPIPPILCRAFSGTSPSRRLFISLLLTFFLPVTIYLLAAGLASFLDAIVGPKTLLHLSSIALPLLLLAQDDYRVAAWLYHYLQLIYYLLLFVLAVAGLVMAVCFTLLGVCLFLFAIYMLTH